jgi:hypothetical protein
MPRMTKAATAKREAEYAAYQKEQELFKLTCRAKWVCGIDSYGEPWRKFIDDVKSGKIPLTPECVAAELELAATKLRLHVKCRARLIEYGSPAHYHSTDLKICQECGHSLGCEHDFEEISSEECRRLGVYHAGMCWHVNRCKLCGEIASYDSSG